VDERSLRVLLVEDDPLVRRTLQIIVRELTSDFVVAEDGAEAMEILGRERFDVVVSDLRMPRVTGLQLLRWIRNEHPTTPVLLITGFAVDEESIRQLGGELLRKPFGPDEAQAAILRLAGRDK
jgi:CheY-like chemotaxis protein